MTNAEKVKAYLTSPILVVQENILIILKQVLPRPLSSQREENKIMFINFFSSNKKKEGKS